MYCQKVSKMPAVLRKLCPCAQSPMCPIAHVLHDPCSITPVPHLNLVCIGNIHWTHDPAHNHISWPCAYVIGCASYIKSKRCQVVKKISNVKRQTYGPVGGSQKSKLTWWGLHILMSILMSHMMSPKALKISMETMFDQFWWASYVMSKFMSIGVNLIISIYFFCEPLWWSMCLTF